MSGDIMYSSSLVKRFIDAIDINNKVWLNPCLTNCYAYALGIDLNVGRRIIELGEISGFDYKLRNKNDLETALMMDSIRLNLNIERVDPDYEIKDNNKWLIAMYMTPFFYDQDINQKEFDNHFLWKTKNDNWSHKIGNTSIITYKDDNGKKIDNPIDIDISIDRNTPYNYIGSYLLTKK